MSREDEPDVLSVWLGPVLTGRLTRTGEGASFALDDDYLRRAGRPVLRQVFEDNPAARRHVRHGVPSWFANLLPEGPLRELIARRAGVHSSRSWFLLELLGLDLPGAVQIRREGAPPGAADDALDESETASDDQPLKFSLAGVQLKFSAFRHERGLTVPVEGRGGDWIVKFPDQRYRDVPEIEYGVMRWARESGIDVPDVMLVDVADIDGLPHSVEEPGGRAFAVKRFDRVEGERIHIEDFAQVLDLKPSEKYGNTNFESIARVVAAVAVQDVDELVRRLVFMVLAGNGDAHVKNWSLIYPDGVRARLAPAYDLLSTTSFVAGDDLALRLGGVRAFGDITLDTFTRFAKRSGLDPDRVAALVADQARTTVEAWTKVRPEFDSVDHVAAGIETRLGGLPLAVG